MPLASLPVLDWKRWRDVRAHYSAFGEQLNRRCGSETEGSGTYSECYHIKYTYYVHITYIICMCKQHLSKLFFSFGCPNPKECSLATDKCKLKKH